jgi:cell wall-associated NlpC family hydrolase
VLTLDLEEYLRGVVPAEVYASYHAEALKAQAIAARTYAARRISSQTTKPYDVDDTTATQAYRPHDRLDPRTDAAVRATTGEVLRYGGRLIDAVYTDSNGGRIVSAKERWGSNVPYLVAKNDPYDPTAARSGHGVGMSQRGAQEMAKQGMTYRQILAFYYPGTALTLEDKTMENDQPTQPNYNAMGIAYSAAHWAEQQLGKPYDQSRRRQDGVFDCSSLVARAYAAVGAPFAVVGADYPDCPTSNLEPYADTFEMLWPPAGRGAMGQSLGGSDALALAVQAGDLIFYHTTTARDKKVNGKTIYGITHVVMVGTEIDTIVHARGTRYGVVKTAKNLYTQLGEKKIVAIMRYSPDTPLVQGMRGNRVKALQADLNAKGARLTVDGDYGAKTAAAVAACSDVTIATGPMTKQVRVTGTTVNVRPSAGTTGAPLGIVSKGMLLALVADGAEWRRVTYKGGEAFIAAKYTEVE